MKQIIILLLLVVACTPQHDTLVLDEKPVLEGGITVLSGAFQPHEYEVAGSARVEETPDGARKLVLDESFLTDNGPELRVYLATDKEASEFVDLGALQSTEGRQEYVLQDEDLSKYSHVLIWCRPFGVTFSYAQLA